MIIQSNYVDKHALLSLKSYNSGQPRTSNQSNDFHSLFCYSIYQSINNKQRFRFSTSTFLVQLEYGNVGFRERGNLEYMYGEKTSRSKGENPILLRCRDLKSVHIGERWMLSRLRYPLIPSLAIYIYDLTDQITFFLVLILSLFQQPLPWEVPIDLFPCYTQRDSS